MGLLEPGSFIAERFRIESVTSLRGTEALYRARDRLTDQRVAIRVLRLAWTEPEAVQFEREAAVLRGLSHRYILEAFHQGRTPQGQPYVVTEWLEGEGLARRLRLGVLPVGESLALVRVLAEALAIGHRRGLAHASLSPACIFLRYKQPALATLLSFGSGRSPGGAPRADAVLGVPGYMAPEQARAGGEPMPCNDIFALGCVLFECLTGRALFPVSSLASSLGQLLYGDLPRVRSLRPDVPAEVEELLARMLERELDRRLSDADALLAALPRQAAFSEPEPMPEPIPPPLAGRSAPPPPPPEPPKPRALATGERSMVSVLWVMPPAESVRPRIGFAEAVGRSARPQPLAAGELAGKLTSVLSRFGAGGDWRPDGSLVATLQGPGATETQRSVGASDLAAQAARLALTIKALWPEALVVLATGLGSLHERPRGEVLERAERLSRELGQGEPALSVPWALPIITDEVTAGLLDARFRLSALRPGQVALLGEAGFTDEARRLLGRPAPCVGREAELRILDVMFAQCRDEPTARIALVLGEAGLGKSHLRYEFQRRLQARGEAVHIFIGRGDPLMVGAPYALLAEALRPLCSVLRGEPPEPRQARLSDQLQAQLIHHLPAADAQRASECISELCAVGFVDEEGERLRPPRRGLAEQVQRATLDLLRAACAVAPVVLILDDLHRSDPGTLRLIDVAMRELSDQPLFVLALARPELLRQHPGLWRDAKVQELRLGELTRKAGERLVEHTLGASVTRSTVEQIVDRSTGNPLYLEELIRAAAAGKREQLPETLLALLQERVLGLNIELRRVLRVASIFGTTFWRGGVQALLGGVPEPLLDDWLHELVASEVIEPHRSSQIPGEVQLGFRHILMRDAAYSLLLDEDRQLGHALAAQYLLTAGVSTPQVLAEHYARGGDAVAAARHYLLAAELAHRGNDPIGARALARRGLRSDLPADLRGELLGLLSQVHLWRAELSDASRYAAVALSRVPPGSRAWGVAMATQIAASWRDRPESFARSLEQVRTIEPTTDGLSGVAFALAVGVFVLDLDGQYARAAGYLERLHTLVEPVAAREPLARAWLHRAHAHREAWVHGAPAEGLRHSEAARDAFLEANYGRGVGVSRVFCGMNAWLLGDLERAEVELRATLAFGEELGIVSPMRLSFLARVLIERGRLEEAEQLARQLLDDASSRGMLMLKGLGRCTMGAVALRQGAFDVAQEELAAGLPLLREVPLEHAAALVTQAELWLQRGEPGRALADADEAVQEMRQRGAIGYLGAQPAVVQAEALLRCGHAERAQLVLGEAHAVISEQAVRIGDPVLRSSFLERSRAPAALRARLGAH